MKIAKEDKEKEMRDRVRENTSLNYGLINYQRRHAQSLYLIKIENKMHRKTILSPNKIELSFKRIIKYNM